MINRLSDQELRALVTSALRGSRDSIKDLLKYYTADMYFVSRLYLDDKETAKSSEQTALRSALKKLGESLNSSDITEWMVNLVRKEALSQLIPVRTTAAYSSYYDSSDEYPTREDVIAFDENECRVRILKALDKVTEPERAALALRFFDHMSIDEIAGALSVSPDESRSLLVSGKAGLRNSGTAIGTLMALCDRVNPERYTAETIVADHEPEITAEPAAAPAAKPAKDEIVLEEVPAQRPVHEEKETVLETVSAEAEPAVISEEPVMEETVRENELPDIVLPQEAPAEPLIVEEPEAVKAVETVDEQPLSYNDAEEEKPVRRKKKSSHAFLKSILAILLGAAAALGLYAYLFMNKPKPAANTNKPQAAETEKPEEQQETETKQEETKEETKEETPAEQPEAPAEPENDIIGTAEVIVDELRIRSNSGTDSAEVDVAVYGTVYDVYEVRSDNDYMWYRIGDDMWIADQQGEWVTYTPAE